MHAAAIDVATVTGQQSLLFMGLPNTGKTSTSVAVRALLAGNYLSEDICFVRSDTLSVFGGPFTLDETKIQNYKELRATKYVGSALGLVVALRRAIGTKQHPARCLE